MYIKCTSSATIWGLYLRCFCVLRNTLLSSVVAEREFLKVADSFVVMSWEVNRWALAEHGFQLSVAS